MFIDFANLPCSSALTVLDIMPRKTGVTVPANIPATGADYFKEEREMRLEENERR